VIHAFQARGRFRPSRTSSDTICRARPTTRAGFSQLGQPADHAVTALESHASSRRMRSDGRMEREARREEARTDGLFSLPIGSVDARHEHRPSAEPTARALRSKSYAHTWHAGARLGAAPARDRDGDRVVDLDLPPLRPGIVPRRRRSPRHACDPAATGQGRRVRPRLDPSRGGTCRARASCRCVRLRVRTAELPRDDAQTSPWFEGEHAAIAELDDHVPYSALVHLFITTCATRRQHLTLGRVVGL